MLQAVIDALAPVSIRWQLMVIAGAGLFYWLHGKGDASESIRYLSSLSLIYLVCLSISWYSRAEWFTALLSLLFYVPLAILAPLTDTHRFLRAELAKFVAQPLAPTIKNSILADTAVSLSGPLSTSLALCTAPFLVRGDAFFAASIADFLAIAIQLFLLLPIVCRIGQSWVAWRERRDLYQLVNSMRFGVTLLVTLHMNIRRFEPFSPAMYSMQFTALERLFSFVFCFWETVSVIFTSIGGAREQI